MRGKKIVFGLIAVIISLSLLEIGVRYLVSKTNYPDFEVFLSMELNQTRYTAEPFLNYVHNSKFINEYGIREFNSLGLKYPSEISVEKPAGVYRILCLGGSTTYGLTEDPANSFPARLEESLNQQISTLNLNCNKIECLNAGLSGATSAEILTHYLFKLNRLQPDLLVIHTGLNDAIMYLPLCNSQYQPDYHNRKRLFPEIPPLNPLLHFLVKSRTIGVIVYLLKYRDYAEVTLEKNPFFEFDNKNEWLPYGNDSMYSVRYNAFYNNIKSLLTIASSNNQKTLLVTEVTDEAEFLATDQLPDTVKNVLQEGFGRNKKFLQKLAIELNTPICELNNNDFPPEFFSDFMHVKEVGELKKARLIEKSLIEIWKN